MTVKFPKGEKSNPKRARLGKSEVRKIGRSVGATAPAAGLVAGVSAWLTGHVPFLGDDPLATAEIGVMISGILTTLVRIVQKVLRRVSDGIEAWLEETPLDSSGAVLPYLPEEVRNPTDREGGGH